MRMERNTAGKRRTMGLTGERSLAERPSAVEAEKWNRTNTTCSKTMKLNPEIDGDETMKYNTAPFLAWG